MSIAAMKQALEALDSDNPDIQLRAATTLRAAIEQAEKPQRVCSGCDKTNTNDSMWAVYCVDCWEKTEALEEVKMELKQEPVAVWELFADGWDSIADPEWMESLPVGTKLYTTPPAAPRQWVGLTEEEIEQGKKESWVSEQAFESAVWWAEAKLKEKNS